MICLITPIVEENGAKITVEEALSEHQFGKVYLMIGINEMGTGTVDSFMKKYEEAVNHIRELQPDALIFLQGIMYVKQEKSETDPIFNNPATKNGMTELQCLQIITIYFILM